MSTKNDKAPTDLELMLYADGELEGEALAAVEAWLARDRTARQKVLALDVASSIVREDALAANPKADDIAALVMGAIAAEAKAAPRAKLATITPIPRKAPFDTTRNLRWIAAAAVAAAAALLLWSRASTQHAGTEPTAALTLPAPHDTAVKVEPRPEHEAARGVEVAAVDFGGQTGAVFYVPTGGAASDTTAVVWLSDSPSGGNE